MKNKETGKLDKEKSQKNKNQKWIKPRHKIITFVVKIFAIPIFYLLGFRWKKLPKNKKPYLIFYNHQTVWDQFILAAMSVKKTYFVMSDDLSSLKILSFSTYVSNSPNFTSINSSLTCSKFLNLCDILSVPT